MTWWRWILVGASVAGAAFAFFVLGRKRSPALTFKRELALQKEISDFRRIEAERGANELRKVVEAKYAEELKKLAESQNGQYKELYDDPRKLTDFLIRVSRNGRNSAG